MLEVVPDHIKAPDGIELRQSDIDENLVGAWCLKSMSTGSILGPFVGDIVYEHNDKLVDYRFAWEVYNLETSDLLHILNATDPHKGNWMRYVNCARYLEEQNLVSVQDGKDIYYRAIKDIKKGEELLTWYEPFKKRRKPRKQNNSSNESKDSAFSDTSSVMENDTGKPKRNRKKKKMFDDDLYFTDLIPKKKRQKSKGGNEKNPEENVCKKPGRKKSNSEVDDGSKTKTKSMKQNGSDSKSKVDNSEKGDNTKKSEPSEGTKLKSKNNKNETTFKKKLEKGVKLDKKGTSKLETTDKDKDDIKSDKGNNSVNTVDTDWTYPDKEREYQFDLQSHFAITSNGRRMYKCDICSGIYRHTFSLKRHYLRNHINCHYLNQMDIGNCMIVVSQQRTSMVSSNDAKTLKRIEQFLAKKLNEEKSGDKIENLPSKSIVMPGLYRCHDCYKLFDYVEELISHTHDHPTVHNEKQFACDKCHMRFPYKQNLVRHRLVHEEEIKPSKRAEKKEMMEVLLTPTGKPVAKPYACPHCSMRFKYIVNLKKHEPIHSADRPFECSSCGKAFPSDTNLKKHIHIAHVGSKVPCKHCSVIFNHVGRLRKHIRVDHPEIHRQRLLKLLDKRGKLSPKAAQRLEETYKNDEDLNARSSKAKPKPKPVEQETEEKEFQYSCIVCKKRFTSYISMCRHRRMAHRNKPQKEEVSPPLEDKPKTEKPKTEHMLMLKPVQETPMPEISDEPFDNSPEAIAEFYANVANNIADNLNYYIDGGESSLTKFKDHIRIEDYQSVFEVQPVESCDTEFKLERFNFPSYYSTSILENNFVSFDDKKFPEEKTKTSENSGDIITLSDRPPGLCTRRRRSRDESVTPDNSRDGFSSNSRDEFSNVSRDVYSGNSRDSLENNENKTVTKVEKLDSFNDNDQHLAEKDNLSTNCAKDDMVILAEKDNLSTNCVKDDMVILAEKDNLSTNCVKDDMVILAEKDNLSTNCVKDDMVILAKKDNLSTNCVKDDMVILAEKDNLSTNCVKDDMVILAEKDNLSTNCVKDDMVILAEKDNLSTNCVKDDMAMTMTCNLETETSSGKTGDSLNVGDNLNFGEHEKNIPDNNEIANKNIKAEITKLGEKVEEKDKESVIDKPMIPVGGQTNSEVEARKGSNTINNQSQELGDSANVGVEGDGGKNGKHCSGKDCDGDIENGNNSAEEKHGCANVDVEGDDGRNGKHCSGKDCDEVIENGNKSAEEKHGCGTAVEEHNEDTGIKCDGCVEGVGSLKSATSKEFESSETKCSNSTTSECDTNSKGNCVQEKASEGGGNCTGKCVQKSTAVLSTENDALKIETRENSESIKQNDVGHNNQAKTFYETVGKDVSDKSAGTIGDNKVEKSHIEISSLKLGPIENSMNAGFLKLEESSSGQGHSSNGKSVVSDKNVENKDGIKLNVQSEGSVHGRNVNVEKSETNDNISFSRDGFVCKDQNLLSGSTVVIKDSVKSCMQNVIDDVDVSGKEQNDDDSDGGSSGILLMNLSSDSGLDSDDPDFTDSVLKGLELSKSPSKSFSGTSNLDILSTVCAIKSEEMRKNESSPLIINEKTDEVQQNSQHSYDTIAFGKHGQVSYVCSVCIKHFRDSDLLVRHQIKKHPSIYCQYLEVEEGNEIEYLYYAEPCNVGVLGMSGKALENAVNKSSYTCTRCCSSFKNVDRLRVHIVNCAPKPVPEPEERPKRKYKKRMKNLDDSENGNQKQSEREDPKDSSQEMGEEQLPFRSNKLRIKRRRFMGCRKRKCVGIPDTPEGSPIKVNNINKKRGKSIDLRYNPGNHIRRRELTELLDKHQCNGCGVKFKTISLLERHIKKCDRKEKFKDLKVMKSQINETFHKKLKHTCLYCHKGFIYPKTLMNHYKAFCLIKKEKVSKVCLTDDERREEMLMMVKLKQQDEDRSLRTSVDFDMNKGKNKKGGWPKGVKRKLKRKGHSWTSIKKRKVSNEDNGDKTKNGAVSKKDEGSVESSSMAVQCEDLVFDEKDRMVQSGQDDNTVLVTIKSGSEPATKVLTNNLKKKKVVTGKNDGLKSSGSKKSPGVKIKDSELGPSSSNENRDASVISAEVKVYKKSNTKSVSFSDGTLSVTVLNPKAKSPAKNKTLGPIENKISGSIENADCKVKSQVQGQPDGTQIHSLKSPKCRSLELVDESSVALSRKSPKSSKNMEKESATNSLNKKSSKSPKDIQKSAESHKKSKKICKSPKDIQSTAESHQEESLTSITAARRNLQAVLCDVEKKTTPKKRKKQCDSDENDLTDSKTLKLNSPAKLEIGTNTSISKSSPSISEKSVTGSPKHSPKKIAHKESKELVKSITVVGSSLPPDVEKMKNTAKNKASFTDVPGSQSKCAVLVSNVFHVKSAGEKLTNNSSDLKKKVHKVETTASNKTGNVLLGDITKVKVIETVSIKQVRVNEKVNVKPINRADTKVCDKISVKPFSKVIVKVNDKNNVKVTDKAKVEDTDKTIVKIKSSAKDSPSKNCDNVKKSPKKLKQSEKSGNADVDVMKVKSVSKSFTVPINVSNVGTGDKKSTKILKLNTCTKLTSKTIPDSPQSDISR